MHFIKMPVEATFLYRSVPIMTSYDTLSFCFVVRDELVEYKVYEGLAPIIFFFDMSMSWVGAEC
jgi:hypothetical protein